MKAKSSNLKLLIQVTNPKSWKTERERERGERVKHIMERKGQKNPFNLTQPTTPKEIEREREIQRFLHGRKKEYCEFDYLEHLYRVAN